MSDRGTKTSWALLGAPLMSLILVVSLAVTLVAPRDEGLGDAQRIVYVHVSVAWVSLLSFVVMAGTGMAYLRNRQLSWDAWSHAATEIGWLCCSLTLISGSLWARAAWGTYWTWDPRLTTFFILWMVYSGCLLARESFADRHRRARVCAVLATLGLLDVPLVTMATRWFRGIHPISPEMEPSMRAVLVVTALSFTAFFSLLLTRRQMQLRRKHELAGWTQATQTGPWSAPTRGM